MIQQFDFWVYTQRTESRVSKRFSLLPIFVLSVMAKTLKNRKTQCSTAIQWNIIQP